MSTEPYVNFARRRTPDEVIKDLETRAISSRSTQTFVSFMTRLDVEYNPRLARWYYLVNGRSCSREDAAIAVQDARAEWVKRHGL